MLDPNTLTAMQVLDALTADALYEAEVMRLPKLSARETEELITRARAGDSKARQEFVISCLSHALGKARFFYHARRPQHDEVLDLVQEASLRMILTLDRALATSAPAAYLRGTARRAIMDYCTYHADLIQKPEYSLATLAKMDPHPARVESLDRPLYADGQRIRVELFEAPEPPSEPDEKRQRTHYAALYQALKTLTRKRRSVLVQLYGLYGQPVKTPNEIGPGQTVRDLAYEARKQLREHLAEHLAQMLAPMPEEEA